MLFYRLTPIFDRKNSHAGLFTGASSYYFYSVCKSLPSALHHLIAEDSKRLLEKSASGRRRFLQQTSVIAACVAEPALAQPRKASAAQRSVSIAQLVDVSQAQQDVSKDFLTGSRTGWQDINLRGGLRRRRVEHIACETDGTPASLRAALESVRKA